MSESDSQKHAPAQAGHTMHGDAGILGVAEDGLNKLEPLVYDVLWGWIPVLKGKVLHGCRVTRPTRYLRGEHPYQKFNVGSSDAVGGVCWLADAHERSNVVLLENLRTRVNRDGMEGRQWTHGEVLVQVQIGWPVGDEEPEALVFEQRDVVSCGSHAIRAACARGRWWWAGGSLCARGRGLRRAGGRSTRLFPCNCKHYDAMHTHSSNARVSTQDRTTRQMVSDATTAIATHAQIAWYECPKRPRIHPGAAHRTHIGDCIHIHRRHDMACVWAGRVRRLTCAAQPMRSKCHTNRDLEESGRSHRRRNRENRRTWTGGRTASL